MKSSFIVFSIVIALTFLIKPSSLYASQLDLSLSPPLTEVIAAPGNLVQTPITLTNHTENPLIVHTSFTPFRPTGEDGSINLAHDSKPFEAQSWFHIEKSGLALADEFELRPHETVQLTLAIAVPKETLPSDHYITVVFEAQSKNPINGTEGQTVSMIQAAVGGHILLSVSSSPSLSFLAKLTEFSAQTLYFEEPLAFRLVLENQGPNFTHAKGNIAIFDVGGRQVQTIPIPSQLLLSGSKRNLASNLPLIPSKDLFGKYTAKATIEVDEGKVLTGEVNFYVLPKNVMLTILVTVAILASISRKFHLYAKWRQNFRFGRSRRH